MPDFDEDKPPLSLATIAREEFWIVAKSFFAPIYGPFLVVRQLLRQTRELDRPPRNAECMPAE